MDDQITFPGKTGSVYVINYNTLQVVCRLYTGHQPHGIAVDDENGRVYISNRNVTLGGPAPHHSSVCNGRNGYMTAIDLNSLLLIPNFQAEVSVDPYGVGITH
jgi:DNA-binding beta-propeller fold protein YncE